MSARFLGNVGLYVDENSLGADAPQGWKTPYVLVFLILGILLLVAFVVWEIKYPYAMIDMKIWKDRDFTLVSGHSHPVLRVTTNRI